MPRWPRSGEVWSEKSTGDKVIVVGWGGTDRSRGVYWFKLFFGELKSGLPGALIGYEHGFTKARDWLNGYDLVHEEGAKLYDQLNILDEKGVDDYFSDQSYNEACEEVLGHEGSPWGMRVRHGASRTDSWDPDAFCGGTS